MFIFELGDIIGIAFLIVFLSIILIKWIVGLFKKAKSSLKERFKKK